ncbi:MAG: hypothetical protein JXB45_08270 [Candidatus Krumholzibacteriota bacterium]|nr:hypothetical protein [Candidatus Krumholzibacteriota bacterium]
MTSQIKYTILIICVVSLAVILTGCAETIFTGTPDSNRAPEVWLTSGPVEHDTTGYQVHFYWSGWDPDGEIDYFEFTICDGGDDPIGFSPADTANRDNWFTTTGHDSVFRVAADENPRRVKEGTATYVRYDKTHTFFLRAVDLQGKKSVVVTRSFTAWTIAPTVLIERPARSATGSYQYSTKVSFGWTASDPIDALSNLQDPDSIRYLHLEIDNEVTNVDKVIADMNANPMDYEELWCPWIFYRAPGDSGRATMLGDDEILKSGSSYIFAVQAKDEAGAVTAIFNKTTNVRYFQSSVNAGPMLTIEEPYLGFFKFQATNFNPVLKELPPGVELNFSWKADAQSYGAEIVGFRYGWDVLDVNNPSDWAVPYGPNRTSPPKTLYAGTHTFMVEALDNSLVVTRGTIVVEIVPFSMERNLLWVDDFYAPADPLPLKNMPSEGEHDEFWIGICEKADGFFPERDVYDGANYSSDDPPPIRVIAKYKNIIWTYNEHTNRMWAALIMFTPEDAAATSAERVINYLPLFLAKGGHLLSCGNVSVGPEGGGLYDAFPTKVLLPAVFKNDMREGSTTDTSGVNSMPYRDYCVSVVDRVTGIFHSGEGIPTRWQAVRDAMRWAQKDANDNYFPNWPQRLELWSEITAPGMFYDPAVRGFLQVEVYDPQYWLIFKLIYVSQQCFHPIYRIITRSTLSPLNEEANALILTKYEHIKPEVKEGLSKAAKSFHFGFELWYFNKQSVDIITDDILNEWGILK